MCKLKSLFCAALLLLLSTACREKKPPAVITDLFETYEGICADITITDLKAYPFPSEEDNILILVEVEIVNVSEQMGYIASPGSYRVYVEDRAVSRRSWESVFDFTIEEFRAQIALGKWAKGYWGIVVPKDTASFEIQIKDDYSKYAVFQLDVPSVTEIG